MVIRCGSGRKNKISQYTVKKIQAQTLEPPESICVGMKLTSKHKHELNKQSKPEIRDRSFQLSPFRNFYIFDFVFLSVTLKNTACIRHWYGKNNFPQFRDFLSMHISMFMYFGALLTFYTLIPIWFIFVEKSSCQCAYRKASAPQREFSSFHRGGVANGIL